MILKLNFSPSTSILFYVRKEMTHKVIMYFSLFNDPYK